MRANKAIKLLTDLNDWVDVWVATGVQVIELQGVVDFVLDSDCKTQIEEMEALPRLNQRSVVAAHAGSSYHALYNNGPCIPFMNLTKE